MHIAATWNASCEWENNNTSHISTRQSHPPSILSPIAFAITQIKMLEKCVSSLLVQAIRVWYCVSSDGWWVEWKWWAYGYQWTMRIELSPHIHQNTFPQPPSLPLWETSYAIRTRNSNTENLQKIPHDCDWSYNMHNRWWWVAVRKCAIWMQVLCPYYVYVSDIVYPKRNANCFQITLSWRLYVACICCASMCTKRDQELILGISERRMKRKWTKAIAIGWQLSHHHNVLEVSLAFRNSIHFTICTHTHTYTYYKIRIPCIQIQLYLGYMGVGWWWVKKHEWMAFSQYHEAHHWQQKQWALLLWGSGFNKCIPNCSFRSLISFM